MGKAFYDSYYGSEFWLGALQLLLQLAIHLVLRFHAEFTELCPKLLMTDAYHVPDSAFDRRTWPSELNLVQ